jgi:glycosyltransferase involved in cell wall biosynthesis
VRRERPPHLLVVGLIWPAETFIERKLAGLAARGWRVTVAVSFVRGRDPRIPGVRVVRVPAGRAGAVWCLLALLVRRPRRVLPLLRAARGTRRLRDFLPLAGLDPDVAHFEWEKWAVTHRGLGDVWGCPLSMSCHGGLQVHVHSPVPPRSEVTPRLPLAFGAMDAVHCVCVPLRELAVRHGADPAKVRIIPSAVDPSFFRPDGRRTAEGGRLRVVAIAWLRWLKGIDQALQALALLDPSVTLDVYGGDPLSSSPEASDRWRLQHSIDELGLAGRVTLHGHVEPEEVRRALRGADVLLHPSLSEGMPTVMLEAMACELPVVVTDVGGVREALSDGVEGIVVPPRDPAALAAALERLRLDPELRRRMGSAGRRRVHAEFTLEQQLDQFEDFYVELMPGPAGSSAASPLRPARSPLPPTERSAHQEG